MGIMRFSHCNLLSSAIGITGRELSGRNARRLAVFLVVLSFVCCARAELDPTQAISRYLHQVWQDGQGLPQNNVLAITQTRDGYLWLGTEEGLARFDGVRFTVYDSGNTPELNNNISSLLADREGNLWIGTLGRLVRLRRGVFTDCQMPEELSGKVVSSLYEDSQGGLWIGTDGGGVGRMRDGRFTHYTTKDGLASNAVFAIGEDLEGSVWIGTHGGLNRWRRGQFTIYSTRNGLPNDDVRALWADRRGDLWVGTQGGLARLRNGIFSTFNRKTGLSTDTIQSLYEDRERTLWIGTVDGGLVRLRNGKFTSYTMRDGLSANAVMAIFGDLEGNLWVGTGTGLNSFSQSAVTSYTTKDGLPSDVILATYEDSYGNLWIGTADHGLSRFRNGKFTSYDKEQGLSSDTVFSLSEDREHNLWIGTRKGLNRFKDGKFTTYTTKNGLAGDTVVAILVDRKGTLWVGGRGGLSRFEGGKFTVFGIREGLSSLLVTSILEDRTGALWIGTDVGLHRFKDGRFDCFTTKNSGLSNDYVLSLYEDPQGVLWIGTDGGGLNRYKGGNFARYTAGMGFFDDRVMQILDGDDGNLWMSSNRGIFCVNKQQLNDFAEGKARSIRSVVLGAEDGMKSKECNGGFQPAGWKTREGKLLFPTMKGLAIVDPRHLNTGSFIPPVVIESATVDNKTVPIDVEAIRPPSRGDLEFQYTAPSFVSPQKTRFQYRLEGYDREWVESAGRRIAHYTNIPPGAYRFRVRTCNGEGLPNGEGVAFKLVLKPHFYQTYWFYALCGLTGLAVVITLVQVRLKHLQLRQQELTILVEQRTAELRGEILVRQRTEDELKRARDEAIRARDELHFQANHDALTGIWNRRAILDLLNGEIERASRSQTTTGLLMLDVDHFKRINDTYGHPSGDVVLSEIARRIGQVLRSYDFVGRYGGEEFMVVLPGCDQSEAWQCAERVRLAIAEQPVSALATEIVVTISIGAAISLPATRSAMEILTAADTALYQAKSQGRNRTAVMTVGPNV
ncbi:MAG: two-component regulator propeller domain-containing protein [Terriglobales bacterium]|jgi:diguanylate cyclase (GGDEF)-like protein